MSPLGRDSRPCSLPASREKRNPGQTPLPPGHMQGTRRGQVCPVPVCNQRNGTVTLPSCPRGGHKSPPEMAPQQHLALLGAGRLWGSEFSCKTGPLGWTCLAGRNWSGFPGKPPVSVFLLPGQKQPLSPEGWGFRQLSLCRELCWEPCWDSSSGGARGKMRRCRAPGQS